MCVLLTPPEPKRQNLLRRGRGCLVTARVVPVVPKQSRALHRWLILWGVTWLVFVPKRTETA